MTRATGKRRTSPLRSARERFEALAIRRDVSLGTLRVSNAGDFALVLAAAALAFPAGRDMSEREVNEILRVFLAGAGAMLATDHVELRRWLVDFGVLARDGFGRIYRCTLGAARRPSEREQFALGAAHRAHAAGSPAPEIAALASELAGIDLARLARCARTDEALRRAERKERWLDTQRKAGA